MGALLFGASVRLPTGEVVGPDSAGTAAAARRASRAAKLEARAAALTARGGEGGDDGAASGDEEYNDEDDEEDEEDGDADQMRAFISSRLVRPVEVALVPPIAGASAGTLDAVQDAAATVSLKAMSAAAQAADRAATEAAAAAADAVAPVGGLSGTDSLASSVVPVTRATHAFEAVLQATRLASRPRILIDVVIAPPRRVPSASQPALLPPGARVPGPALGAAGPSAGPLEVIPTSDHATPEEAAALLRECSCCGCLFSADHKSRPVRVVRRHRRRGSLTAGFSSHSVVQSVVPSPTGSAAAAVLAAVGGSPSPAPGPATTTHGFASAAAPDTGFPFLSQVTADGQATYEPGPAPPAHATPATSTWCWRHAAPPVWVPAGPDFSFAVQSLARNSAHHGLLTGSLAHAQHAVAAPVVTAVHGPGYPRRESLGAGAGPGGGDAADEGIVAMAATLANAQASHAHATAVISRPPSRASSSPPPLTVSMSPPPCASSLPPVLPGLTPGAGAGAVEGTTAWFLVHPCCGSPPAELLADAVARERVRRRALRLARRAAHAARTAARQRAAAETSSCAETLASLAMSAKADKRRDEGKDGADDDDDDDDDDNDHANGKDGEESDLGNSDDDDVRTDDEALAPFLASLGPCTPFEHEGPVCHPPRMRALDAEEAARAAELELQRRRKREADRERRARAPRGSTRTVHLFDADAKPGSGAVRIDAAGERNAPWFSIKYTLGEKRTWSWLTTKLQTGFRKLNMNPKRKATALELRHALTQQAVASMEDLEELFLRDGTTDLVICDTGAPLVNKFVGKDGTVTGNLPASFDKPRQLTASSPWWATDELARVVRHCCVCGSMFQNSTNTPEENEDRGQVCSHHRAKPERAVFLPLYWEVEPAARHHKRTDAARVAREALVRAKALDALKQQLLEAQAQASQMAAADLEAQRLAERAARVNTIVARLRDEGLSVDPSAIERSLGVAARVQLPGQPAVVTPAQLLELAALRVSGLPWRVVRVWDSATGGQLARGRGAAPLFTLRFMQHPRLTLEVVLTRVAQAMLHLGALAAGRLTPAYGPAPMPSPLALPSTRPIGPSARGAAALLDGRLSQLPPLPPGLGWPLSVLPERWLRPARALLGGAECPGPITASDGAITVTALAAAGGAGSSSGSSGGPPKLRRRASLALTSDALTAAAAATAAASASMLISASSSMPSLLPASASGPGGLATPGAAALAGQPYGEELIAVNEATTLEAGAVRAAAAVATGTAAWLAALPSAQDIELRHPVTREVFVAFSRQELRDTRAFAVAEAYNEERHSRMPASTLVSRRNSVASGLVAAVAGASAAAAASAASAADVLATADVLTQSSRRGGLPYARALLSLQRLPPPAAGLSAPPPPPGFSRGLVLDDYADAFGQIDVVAVRAPTAASAAAAGEGEGSADVSSLVADAYRHPTPAVADVAALVSVQGASSRAALQLHRTRAEAQLIARECVQCRGLYCTREQARSSCTYHFRRAVPVAAAASDVSSELSFCFPCCGTQVSSSAFCSGALPLVSIDFSAPPEPLSTILVRVKPSGVDPERGLIAEGFPGPNGCSTNNHNGPIKCPAEFVIM